MMISLRYSIIAPAMMLGGLGACVSAQQQCIATTSAQARALQAQIEQTQATIARGYALHQQTVQQTIPYPCKDQQSTPCLHSQTQQIETPVSVDMEQQKSRLVQLKARFTKAQRQALAGIESCKNTYPK